MRFENQVAVITGAASGLGRAYAISLAERGASIVLIDQVTSVDGQINEELRAALFRTQTDIANLGCAVLLFDIDIASASNVVNVVNQIVDVLGKIDILINNAGLHQPCSFDNLTLKAWQRQLDVDLNGSFYFTKAVWPIMKRQQYGRIVMTTGGNALYGEVHETAFSASRMALIGLVNSLSIESDYYNIHVNSLAPQAVTAMTSEHLAESVKPLFTKDSVTACMRFLVSRDAPNGQHVLVAAGSVSHGQFVEYSPKQFQQDQCSSAKIATQWPTIYQALPVHSHDNGESQILAWARRSAGSHDVGLG